MARLRLSVFQGASHGDFLLAPACPIEKVMQSEIGETVVNKQVSSQPGIIYTENSDSFILSDIRSDHII